MRDERLSLVSRFARHRTAANLLMVLMILLGLVALMRINVQFFPSFGIDVISVSVEWPGAGAEDVDANIVEALEPELRFLDNVKHVKSTSREGLASVSVEFEAGSDMQSALSDVETTIAQITTLPEDSEKPIVRRIIRYEPITRLLISGPYPEAALKALSKQIRDELLDRGVDKVDLVGARAEEIWVDVLPETLRQLDLKIDDVAKRIAELSQDIPAGETGGAQSVQLRGIGEATTAEEVAALPLLARANGEKVLLSDVAEVREAFDADDAEVLYNQMIAVELLVRRSEFADALVVDEIVQTYLKDARPRLPEGVTLVAYEVQADLIKDRIDLLIENGVGGLIIVLGVLFLFLNTRVAFWVAAGIPISLLATLFVMYVSGQSINMVSLFGLIMAIGIVVDDAIVVGEHTETLRRQGLPPIEAAEQGARRMLVPVFASSLTTIAAFMPLLAISDIIGQIISAIPFVAIAVIIASLIECFFVLPGHMRHALKEKPGGATGLRKAFKERFDHFRDNGFARFLEWCLDHRYSTLATTLTVLIICFGLVAGGRVGFQFFSGPEGERVFANVEMVAGTSRADTRAMVEELERALYEAEEILGGNLIVTHVAKLGTGASQQGGGSGNGDHLGGFYVELVPSDARDVRTDTFIKTWEETVQFKAGVDNFTILPAQAGPPGRDVDVRLTGPDLLNLKQASQEIQNLLKGYPGVSAVSDDLPFGKEEAILTLTPLGEALGFSIQTVVSQVRDGFDGRVARRFARGDEEVLIRVQFDREHTGRQTLEQFFIRSPDGQREVPLSQVVDITYQTGFATVKREDGSRQLAITAEINKGVTNTNEILEALKGDGVETIAKDWGADVSFAGKAEEQQRTFGDMATGAFVGLSAIYIILAWVFASYSKPIVVMSVIPFGFVGAVIGHMVLGFDMTILSLVALIGLSGIVVNDSIILVSTIKERMDKGEAPLDAIKNGSRDRLRAVVLTSATTIGGLTPLMFETSLQAQFLIPMAVTLVFGLMVATVLVLIIIPCLLAVIEDLRPTRKKFPALGDPRSEES